MKIPRCGGAHGIGAPTHQAGTGGVDTGTTTILHGERLTVTSHLGVAAPTAAMVHGAGEAKEAMAVDSAGVAVMAATADPEATDTMEPDGEKHHDKI